MENEQSLGKGILKRILVIVLAIIILLTIGVKAANSQTHNVSIQFSDDCEVVVLTNKTKVADILAENHIIILEDETVYPDKESNIDISKKIVISKKVDEPIVISEQTSDITTEEILGKYVTIVEKIIVEQVEIPFETITKDISNSSNTENKVLQEGKNGIKEIKYKVKYQNDVEIERTEISSQVIKEPVQKIIQISSKAVQVASRSGDRSVAQNSANALAAKVANITPTVSTFNTSAYCACVSCCGKTNGITSSGQKASSWYTLAGGKNLPIGTIVYIPALSNKPNGGWFVVQDRGGAITNNKLDIYMDSHGQALQYGRKSLECYVYKF